MLPNGRLFTQLLLDLTELNRTLCMILLLNMQPQVSLDLLLATDRLRHFEKILDSLKHLRINLQKIVKKFLDGGLLQSSRILLLDNLLEVVKQLLVAVDLRLPALLPNIVKAFDQDIQARVRILTSNLLPDLATRRQFE